MSSGACRRKDACRPHERSHTRQATCVIVDHSKVAYAVMLRDARGNASSDCLGPERQRMSRTERQHSCHQQAHCCHHQHAQRWQASISAEKLHRTESRQKQSWAGRRWGSDGRGAPVGGGARRGSNEELCRPAQSMI